MSQDQIFLCVMKRLALALPCRKSYACNRPCPTHPEPSALTIQATGAWSQKHLYDDPQLVSPALRHLGRNFWTDTSFLMLARIAGFAKS